MPETTSKPLPACLREARLRSGYPNRDTAAAALHRSPETIGRHERGEVPVCPDDVLDYAARYNKPDLLFRFCGECPISAKLREELQGYEFNQAANRLFNRLRKAMDIGVSIMEIADDGVVNPWEREAFIDALKSGNSIIAAFEEMKLWALNAGVITLEDLKENEDRPAATGTALG